jgi:hypothetical protein
VIPSDAIDPHYADLRGLAARRNAAEKAFASKRFKLADWLKQHKTKLALDASRSSSYLPNPEGSKRPIVVHHEKLETWLRSQALMRAKAGHHSNKHKVLPA